MLTISDLVTFTQDKPLKDQIETIWASLNQAFELAQSELPSEWAMDRTEISFHSHVRLLGYLVLLTRDVPGDIVEIGVWKGKSLALMAHLAPREKRVIGVDPFELPRQFEEARFYRDRIYPQSVLIRGYSELCAAELRKVCQKTSLLHIDGGHKGRNVLLDFLLYAEQVQPGGFVVFDDYRDFRYSPEVGPAVDLLRAGGYFRNFNVLGPMPGFDNSYLLQRRQ